MGEVSIIGVDLAKNVFQLHGAAADGSVVFRKKLSCPQFARFMAEHPACEVAMEACPSAHHWVRELTGHGHGVRLIAPHYVKPFLKRQKNDAADAEAIAEAATRPTMRFVEPKTEEQQSRAVAFRAREQLVKQRTEAINALRAYACMPERVFVKINGVTHYLWRAVDHEGEVLEAYVSKSRDRKSALKFLKKTLKRHGRPHVFVTDKFRSYGAALKDLGLPDERETGRWLNNRAENSHQPFRRRERAMLRFRRMRSLQKFVAVHSSIHNLFNAERALTSRDIFKANRTAALTEWRQLCAA